MRTYRFRVEWNEPAENDEVAGYILDEILGEIKTYDDGVKIVASDVQILPREAGDEAGDSDENPRLSEELARSFQHVAAVDDDTGEPIIGELEEAYGDDAKKEWEEAT